MKADKTNYNAYNHQLQPFANALRKEMTKAEVCLWKYALRVRKMKGYQFRRQRPVLNFIADFMCQPLNLIIEVDGNIHHLEKIKAKDAFKDNVLHEAGFTVIRFTNQQVLRQMAWVIDEIERVIGKIETSTPVTHKV